MPLIPPCYLPLIPKIVKTEGQRSCGLDDLMGLKFCTHVGHHILSIPYLSLDRNDRMWAPHRDTQGAGMDGKDIQIVAWELDYLEGKDMHSDRFIFPFLGLIYQAHTRYTL